MDYTEMIEELGGIHAASSMGRPAVATRLGISEWKARRLIDHLRALRETDSGIVSALRLDGREPIEALLQRRGETFKRRLRAADQGAHQIRVKDNLPIGIAHYGDPHCDDDGCDVLELQRWMSVVSNTPGMFAATVGDVTNNWCGRLERLYAHQGTTHADAVRLIEWFFQNQRWLYIIEGNHDAWGAGSVIMRLLADRARVEVYEPHEARIEIRWDDDTLPVSRVVARHDFKGHSMWNNVHGAIKKSRTDPWPGDLYVCGHKHNYAHYAEEAQGRVVHHIRLTGFKTLDDYADAHGFPPSRLGHAAVTIHDPHATPAQRITVIPDPEEAAERLIWLRKRRAKT